MDPMAMVAAAKYQFREEWLDAMTDVFREVFFNGDCLSELPRVRLSCGFPKGGRGRVIGQCWSSKCSKDKTYEIFIHPEMDDAIRVADILLHELIHAAVGHECGHKGPFKKAALAVGLEGPMTATVAGEELRSRLNTFVERLGAYPHAGLVAMERTKKEGTRNLKLTCPGCGMIIHTTKKWLDHPGAPKCACGCEKSFERV